MNILLDNDLEHIPFGDFSYIDLENAIVAQLKIANDVINKQLKSQQYSWDVTIVEIDNVLYKLNSIWSLIHHLLSVMDNDELRKIQDKYQGEVTNFYLNLAQNEQLFNVFNTLKTLNLNQEQMKVIDNSLFEFKQNGFYLNAEDRTTFNDVIAKLDNLTTKFAQNVIDSTENSAIYVEFDQLDGIPNDIIQLYKEQAAVDGYNELYKINFHMSSYLPLMQYANNRQLRQKAYQIYVTRASELAQKEFDNKAIINEIILLRYKKAKLLGYNDYTSLSLVKKMANNSTQIIEFLDNLIDKSLPYAKNELTMLEEYAKTNYNIDKLEPWDVSYLSEKLKNEQYQYSEQELKQYFEINNVLKGLFELINNLYKIDFISNASIKLWHLDVIYFDIYQDNNYIGGIYFDLFSRDKKHSGAWMNSMQDRYVTKNFDKKPIAYIICNFTPKNDQGKSYLTIEEVQTIFHEMGHALHHLLTNVKHYSISGINNVEWDAVELPSQFMELFTWNYDILSKLSSHAITSKILPLTLFNKVLKARYYQAGLQMLRQIEFAKFDLLLHNYQEPQKLDYERLLNQIRQITSLIPTTSYNKFANSFTHIFAGGYAAGYYSYKWAEVLACDVFSEFEHINKVDELYPIGRKFVQTILAKGGLDSMADNFLAFMGREPKIDALLKYSFGE